MKESQHLWSLIKKNFSPDVDMCRVENLVGVGSRWRIEMQNTQPPRLRRRLEAGGRVWVLVRCEDQIRLIDAFNVVFNRTFTPLKGKRKVSTLLHDAPVRFATSKPFNSKGLEDAIFAKC